MPIYEYKGLNKKGNSTKGTIDADNVRTAKLKLKKKGVYVQSLKDRSKSSKGKKAKKRNNKRKANVKDLAMLTRQLATLLKANIPLVDSLQAVSEQVENESLAETMAEIKNAAGNKNISFSRFLSFSGWTSNFLFGLMTILFKADCFEGVRQTNNCLVLEFIL